MRKKGQSELLAHTLMIAFTIILVLVVLNSINGIKRDYKTFIGKLEVNETCYQIKNAVLMLESNDNFDQQINETVGQIDMMLPEKIGGSYYRGKMVNRKFVISLFTGETYNCTIGFNVTGQTPGGLTYLKRKIYENDSVGYEIGKI